MTLEFTDQVRATRSAFYDGTNGAELVAQFGGQVILDTGTELTYLDQGVEYTVPLGHRIFWSSSETSNGYAENLVDFPWITFSLATVTGSGEVPESALEATQTVDVVLSPVAYGSGLGMAGTAFTPMASLRGAPAIARGHSILDAVPLSATSVRVSVSSEAGALAGATVYVVAQQMRIV